ncbi:MAG: hypothetical protein R3B93_08530 [Bacteroidia bacterium]
MRLVFTAIQVWLFTKCEASGQGYKSLEGQLTGFDPGTFPLLMRADYHWGAVANATLSLFLKSCFQTASSDNLALISDLEEQFAAEFRTEAPIDIINRSIAYGQSVGNAMLVYANSRRTGGICSHS